MIDFILALQAYSSMTCVSRQQQGIASVEFTSQSAAEAFAQAIKNELAFTGEPLVPSYVQLKNRVRFANNYWALFRVFADIEEDPKVVARWLPPDVYGKEGDDEVVRFALTWRFESGNKATELFDRLHWILEN